jgi:hypothetical protein
LSERLKNYQENAKGGANDRRASENITSPRKLPSNTIAVDSGSEETGSVKRPESASDNSTKQAFSLAKEAFASPTAPRRRSTTSKKAAAPADTEVKKGAVLKSKELLGSNASSATKDAISERPADINEAVTKDAFGKAKDAFTSPSSNPKSLTTSSEKPADISEVATKDVFSKAKNVFAAPSAAITTAAFSEKPADIGEVATKDVFSKAKDAFTAPSAAITTAAFSEKPADIGEVATKDVFYKAKSAFAGGQTDTHVEQGQQQQPISRRVSIRDNEKVSVRDRVNNYPLGREANESNPESPVPAPRRVSSFSSWL